MTTDNSIEPKLIVTAIDAAGDPLDRLVEKTAIDPGAPFAPDVLERLVWPAVRDRRCAFIVIGKRKLMRIIRAFVAGERNPVTRSS